MRHLIRYGLVGLANNFVLYIGYILLIHFGTGPKTSMTIVYFIGANIGFMANKKWTFEHYGSTKRAGVLYLVSQILGYLLNFLILSILVDHFGFAHQWVQVLGIIFVAGFLFVFSKYIIFKKMTT